MMAAMDMVIIWDLHQLLWYYTLIGERQDSMGLLLNFHLVMQNWTNLWYILYSFGVLVEMLGMWSSGAHMLHIPRYFIVGWVNVLCWWWFYFFIREERLDIMYEGQQHLCQAENLNDQLSNRKMWGLLFSEKCPETIHTVRQLFLFCGVFPCMMDSRAYNIW